MENPKINRFSIPGSAASGDQQLRSDLPAEALCFPVDQLPDSLNGQTADFAVVQPGGAELRAAGYKLASLAIVDTMTDDQLTFREQ